MITEYVGVTEAKRRLENVKTYPMTAKVVQIYNVLTRIVDAGKQGKIQFASKGEHNLFERYTISKYRYERKNPARKTVKKIAKKAVKKTAKKKTAKKVVKKVSRVSYSANEKSAMSKMTPARKKAFKALIASRKKK